MKAQIEKFQKTDPLSNLILRLETPLTCPCRPYGTPYRDHIGFSWILKSGVSPKQRPKSKFFRK